MTTLTNGFAGLAFPEIQAPSGKPLPPQGADRLAGPDPECLRRRAWEIGETRAADSFAPAASHVGLAMVSPGQGFAHWRILPGWVEQTAWQRGHAWHHCRLILRLYDVSYLHFNGFNAHHIQDHLLPGLCGHLFFGLSRPGTCHLAEVGFLLRSGEFIPAARSRTVHFPPNTASSHRSQAALYVSSRRLEEVGNLWDQERILRERRQPRLRKPLRIATLAWGASACGHEGVAARFVAELATGQYAHGHEAHVFLPASGPFQAGRVVDGVPYHALEVSPDGTPLDRARSFARAAERLLQDLPPFDLLHVHDWMAGLARWSGRPPTVLALESVEATRRNGAPPSDLSLAIEEAEREVARTANCVLTPGWLREQAGAGLGIDGARVHAFPLEGRLPNEWECPLDCGQVKTEIGVGPLDRLLLFVGPLEHATGVDLLPEALPTLLQRAPQVRLALVGLGHLHGVLEYRAGQLGVAHALRLLGHVEGPALVRLLRAAEALVLPSRHRVPFDDAVVDLARRAGRPVVTTHGGPAHLVRHEETGLVTYDNPGSMVWAFDRILGDPGHAERLGRNGRRNSDSAPVWGEVARQYLELCGAVFPTLTETHE
jgi:glycosyltransferase involved in cell wall biosynthesis